MYLVPEAPEGCSQGPSGCEARVPPSDSMSALPADEIMHQDIVPLCAADIQEQLKKRFAYLSGKFRKPGVRGTARAWPVSGCFIALCEAPGRGEEVRTLSSVPLSTGQCPRSGELLRREVYLTHSCEGPRLRDAS